MKFCYVDKTFRRKSLALIKLCNEILASFRAKGYELTLRQLYYQLVARAVIENNERSYDNIGAMVSDARLAGLIDWNAIVDRTRSLKALPHWDDPADIINSSAQGFNYDKWDGQGTRIEVWVEKDALVDVIGQAANAYDVPFFSCRGYTSQSEMWGAAMRILNYYDHHNADNVVILHLGDHDPSGLDMSRDIEDRLTLFCEAHGQPAPVIQRIALNMDQVRKYNPPPNPAKLSDCRVQKYMAEHGDQSWELDALDPEVITKLIHDHIEQYLDREKFDAQCERQDEARAQLRQIADGYDNILVGQKELAAINEALGADPDSSVEGIADTVAELKEAATERSALLDKATAEITSLKAKLAKKAKKKKAKKK